MRRSGRLAPLRPYALSMWSELNNIIDSYRRVGWKKLYTAVKPYIPVSSFPMRAPRHRGVEYLLSQGNGSADSILEFPLGTDA